MDMRLRGKNDLDPDSETFVSGTNPVTLGKSLSHPGSQCPYLQNEALSSLRQCFSSCTVHTSLLGSCSYAYSNSEMAGVGLKVCISYRSGALLHSQQPSRKRIPRLE